MTARAKHIFFTLYIKADIRNQSVIPQESQVYRKSEKC